MFFRTVNGTRLPRADKPKHGTFVSRPEEGVFLTPSRVTIGLQNYATSRPFYNGYIRDSFPGTSEFWSNNPRLGQRSGGGHGGSQRVRAFQIELPYYKTLSARIWLYEQLPLGMDGFVDLALAFCRRWMTMLQTEAIPVRVCSRFSCRRRPGTAAGAGNWVRKESSMRTEHRCSGGALSFSCVGGARTPGRRTAICGWRGRGRKAWPGSRANEATLAV
jgi:hypothetical protein